MPRMTLYCPRREVMRVIIAVVVTNILVTIIIIIIMVNAVNFPGFVLGMRWPFYLRWLLNRVWFLFLVCDVLEN